MSQIIFCVALVQPLRSSALSVSVLLQQPSKIRRILSDQRIVYSCQKLLSVYNGITIVQAWCKHTVSDGYDALAAAHKTRHILSYTMEFGLYRPIHLVVNTRFHIVMSPLQTRHIIPDSNIVESRQKYFNVYNLIPITCVIWQRSSSMLICLQQPLMRHILPDENSYQLGIPNS